MLQVFVNKKERNNFTIIEYGWVFDSNLYRGVEINNETIYWFYGVDINIDQIYG